MKKIYVGIDISKEKCNLCFRSGLEIVREDIQNYGWNNKKTSTRVKA